MTALRRCDDRTAADGRPPLPAGLDAVAFDWLAALFARPPGAAAVAAHHAEPLAGLLADLAADPDLAAPIAALRAATGGEADAAAIRIAVAHGRLFDGLAGPETVPPHESAHVGDGRLFGPAVADMERLIATHDLGIADELREPADHVAIELAVLAHLTRLDHPDRVALAERLAAWVPAFARACAAHDRAGFHAAAARIAAILIERGPRDHTSSRDETNDEKRRTR